MKINPNLNFDIKLSREKWNEIYQNQSQIEKLYNDYSEYWEKYGKDTYYQLNSSKKIDKEIIYLEIGCGTFFLGQKLAKKCRLVIGIDFCYQALEMAKKMLDQEGITNYLLIQGDISNLPIKTNRIDLIYGGGVIEHFKNTQICLNELYRVLKNNGISFNTVPYLNIGSLTYRQIWGNIPDFPILRQTAEFIHLKLLKGRHMIFGYEKSFPGYTLKKLYQKAGFRKIKVEKFTVRLTFEFIPALARKTFVRLANSSKLFWPMVKVIGKKQTGA